MAGSGITAEADVLIIGGGMAATCAEISGVDLSQRLSPAQRDAIRAAILKYKVVFMAVYYE
jgi:taurine dioxygenase